MDDQQKQQQAERVRDFIESLTSSGLSQQQIASRAGLPAQFISDLKKGRRPLTELSARRFGESFGVNFEWLLGSSNVKDPPGRFSAAKLTSKGTLWLPQVPWPIEGDPFEYAEYHGSHVEVSGVAASRASTAKLPYVLRFGAADVGGRLQRGDLVLISQECHPEATFCVIKVRQKLFLARRAGDTYVRLADGKPANSCIEVGHCLGIVWAGLK